MTRLPRAALARTTGALLTITFLPVLIWPGLIKNLFATDFMPHIYCLSGQPALVWLFIASNSIIGVSYVAISLTLVYFVYKKRNLPFHWMFLAFGTFIIACGSTHFMDIWTLWNPTYWLAGAISLITAIASVTTALLLPPLIPQALALPSPGDLLSANRELEGEILERKRAEKALKEQAATLIEQASLLDLTHDTIIVRQLDGTILFWNRGAEAMYGWRKEEALGRVIHELLETEFPQPWKEIVATLIREGRWEGELRHRRRDGSHLIVASRWAMHHNEPGQPLSALEINNDITERKRDEEEIKALNAALDQRAVQLETANRELEAFSYSISHDLRAPLRAMSGFAHILLEDHAAELSAEAAECAQIIAANARQMGELIDDLLAFAHLGRQSLKKQAVAPTQMAHALVDEMHGKLNGRRVRIQIDEMMDCQADPALLKQVYANLIGNALKYTRERDPALIEIGCIAEENNNRAIYFVKDNGIGFDMRYADKLFGVFQRLHSAAEYEGTGVGLALVQRIVQRHGGRVWAEALPDHGATFYFTLTGEEPDDGIGR